MNYYRFLEDLISNVTSSHGDEETALHNNTVNAKPWGDAIGAAILIQMVTLSGLIVVGFGSCFQKFERALSSSSSPSSSSDNNKVWKLCLMEIVIPSFAAGALLATAVFLIIPEGIELLSGDESHSMHHEEGTQLNGTTMGGEGDEFGSSAEEDQHPNGAAWKFGACIIGGVLFPVLLGAIFHPSEHHSLSCKTVVNDEAINETTDVCREEHECDPEDAVLTVVVNEQNTAPKKTTGAVDGTTAVTSLVPQPSRNAPLLLSIILGDMFHNLADGFFVGTAFLLCTKSLAWTIVASTVYHELAQEISDYFLLTHHCGLSRIQALALNFAAGLSVVLGVIIVFSVNLTDQAIGCILSVSAGVYLYIAVGECIPRIRAVQKTTRDIGLFLLFFVIGVVPIGLVLLNHIHCEAGHEQTVEK